MQNKFKKKAGVVIFISVTLVLRAKKSLEIKGILHNDRRINAPGRHNVYDLKNRVSRHMKQKLIDLKGEIDKSTLYLETTIPHSVIDRSTREKLSKGIKELNNTINNSTNSYVYIKYPASNRRIHNLFFKHTGTFTKINQILSHKITLNKLKRVKIIQSMFFDHMEISNKKTTKTLLNIKKFNNGPLIHSSKKKSQRKLKNKTKQNKQKQVNAGNRSHMLHGPPKKSCVF